MATGGFFITLASRLFGDTVYSAFKQNSVNNEMQYFCVCLNRVCVLDRIGPRLDFYGVDVADRDAPSSYMRSGVIGNYPMVTRVHIDTPAHKAGFKHGDIIISINDKSVRRASELNQLETDTLFILVFDGTAKRTVSINRLAIESEKANRLEAAKNAAATASAAKRQRESTDDQSSLPAVKFDDAELKNKYG